MGGGSQVDVPHVTAEPEKALGQPGPDGPDGLAEDQATPNPNRADE